MKLELDLSFLYGSTILPKCILIVCLIIILILDLISVERDTFSLYFISLAGLLISMAYYYSNGTRSLLLVFRIIFKLIVLIFFFYCL